MTRRLGPVLGAGVVVEEKDPERILQAAPLGVTGYIGVTERGSVTNLISCYGRRELDRKIGGRIPASLLPDAAQDFFDHSAGNGELHVIRVTDGTEVQASATFWSRSIPRFQVMTIKAADGGRWGGKAKIKTAKITGVGDLTETTITTGITMLKDEWAGGRLSLLAVPNKIYEIVGNTIAGVVTVKTGSLMLTDFAASSEFAYTLQNVGDANKIVSIVVTDGENSPTDGFGITVYVNGAVSRRYPNLSMDPNSADYYVRVINDDTSNFDIVAVDDNSGQLADATRRPANAYGTIASVTATVLTANVHQFGVSTFVGATLPNPTVTLGSITATMAWRDTLRIVMTSATAYSVFSKKLANPSNIANGVQIGTGNLGTACTYTNLSGYWPTLNIANGSTIVSSGDELYLEWFPFQANGFREGYLYPDKVNAPSERYRIDSNTVNTITIRAGDLTTSGAPADQWMVVGAPSIVGLEGGYDGVASISDSSYTSKLNADTCLWNGLKGQNKGLIKFAAPGVTATAVQKAGVAYADAKNGQWRIDIPSNVLTENGAIDQINTTIGRNDFAVAAWPSFGYVQDFDKPNQLKLVSLTGAIHGREARMANDYQGYHKAGAGTNVILFRVLKLPITTAPNEELLNPVGIQVVKNLGGNFVIWGDRSVSVDPGWRWKHQREMMSHYEQRLLEGFDWLIFSINDKTAQAQALTTLRAMFLPEWQKGAIRGNKFEDAAVIKVDDEINTDLTRANGDLYASIGLRLADTVERFIIRIGKMGIFETAG